MEFVFSLTDIDKAAHTLLQQRPRKVILFNGNMGAGKTTFIKAFCRALGVNDPTSSPTFSLVNEYRTTDNQVVYHFDVYRLKSESEAYDMGIDEYLYSGDWCLIEWADNIPSLIPEIHSVVNISALQDGRRALAFR